MLKDLLKANRSFRRFKPGPALSREDLTDLVDAARLSPSARNAQPLKFILIDTPETCARIFPFCAWAGYLKEWKGPAEAERPTSYIILLGDDAVSRDIDTDAGIACQSILLSAVEKGFGGCILGSIDRPAIRDAFSIDERYTIRYVIALGKPSETVVLDDISHNDIRYYRDEHDVHHVPKRTLDELIIEIL
ncbi:MAG: nitroreductase family protein [Candidatus Marinimicrobia bacterium]|nr:nitroreductase family protein [Candidatus Neomarinimicrobiota bacterium]